MSAKNNIMIYTPIFAGEIIVARKNAMDIRKTKIDDLADGIRDSLPKFSNQEKINHYNKKLKLFWEGKLI